MGILVVAEHDNATLKGATLNTIAAAQAIGGDVECFQAAEATGDRVLWQLSGSNIFHRRCDRPDVLWCSTTTTSNDIDQIMSHEVLHIGYHLFRALIIFSKFIG